MKIINENIKAMSFFFFFFFFLLFFFFFFFFFFFVFCLFFFIFIYFFFFRSLKKEYTNFVGAFFSNISQSENLLCVSESFHFYTR